MLQAQLHKKLGRFSLDLSLEVAAGATVVLVGESGSGKTTALRLLVGLVDPDGGRTTWNGETWYDGASGKKVPTWQRPASYVQQDYALFPHLNVFENVAFGLRAEGGHSRGIQIRVGEELERFRLTPLARHRPHQLSGGQQQRVALARALVLNPAVLLLDEPLSALDLAARRAIRAELRTVLASLTCATVLVTHSPVEAQVFGDRIAVLDQGRIVQAGSRGDLLRHPRSPYIAEFMGVNLLQGAIISRDGRGLARLGTADGEIMVVDPGGLETGVFVTISPREITLHRLPPTGSAQNVFHGPVTEIIPEPPQGERVRVALATRPPLVAEVTPAAVEALGVVVGMPLFASFKATGVIPYR